MQKESCKEESCKKSCKESSEEKSRKESCKEKGCEKEKIKHPDSDKIKSSVSTTEDFYFAILYNRDMETADEKSVGAVVCKIENGSFLFLLVFSAKHFNWGFPKGHVEIGEMEIETARREIFEETGIEDLKFVDGFRYSEFYGTAGVLAHTRGRIIRKNVIYYLCLTGSGFINRNNSEIEKCRWFDFESAEKNLKHPGQKNILKKAKEFLKGGQNESGIGQ